ncbi:ABC transporter substrate-binding protein [Kaistia dalseonensis]|uniref:Thiamine pyrimidine synthase n=1 Tax=Kaistia dalseonensis TaxID=410840 RepID=A0ABU0HDN9_9HYPH|nr:ABC transporter substrate-binding protein [Kaistia dalseonensis]MCX5497789.1 ABC transporter substrate-binding protein [Kaistia dalseonensis]MDQ0440433.1 NitT/TauT family transport system substrate-binding protein [Kaistia dalseonensis]
MPTGPFATIETKRRPLRATAAALGFAAIALAGLGQAQAEELTKLSVVLGYVPNVESFGAEYALKMGYFKDEGLDVTIIPAGQGVDQVQMVSAGTVDIGISNPEQILAGTSQGGKFKVFAAEFQKTPVAMTCRKDSGIEKATDLAGKRLGVKTPSKPFADLFMSKNNIDPATVQTTTIGPNDISVLISGQIDCEVTTFAFNEPRLIEAAGVPVNVFSFGDYGLNSQNDSYFVTEAFFNDPAKKELLVKYLRAEVKAWMDFFKDPDAAAKFMVDGGFTDGLDIDQQTYQAGKQALYMKDAFTAEKGFMWVNPKTWAETAENAFVSKVTDTKIDPTSMLTTEILEKVAPPKM